MQRLPLALVLLTAPLWAEIRGAALVTRPEPAVLTWGSKVQRWPVGGGAPVTLVDGVDYGPGGCVADVDGDRVEDLLVQERPGLGRMLYLRAPEWRARVVETETEFSSCVPFTLGGRRGVILQHLHAQLRFYLFPDFAYKELYSIYTASQQGGLLVRDVDGDGLLDLFTGNYWMRNPGALDVAWRLFAINAWHDTPVAARAALAWWGGELVWAEGEAKGARIARFEPPADVKQLWIEHRMAPLDYPRAVLAQRDGIFIGHAGGVALETRGADGMWMRTEVSHTPGVFRLFEWQGTVAAVTAVGVFRVYPRR